MAMMFADVIEELKRKLTEPNRFHYLLHSPAGPIFIGTASSILDSGCNLSYGRDTENQARVIYFSDDALAKLPIELIEKSTTAVEQVKPKEPIGFHPGAVKSTSTD
jgi:hypothetical protein